MLSVVSASKATVFKARTSLPKALICAELIAPTTHWLSVPIFRVVSPSSCAVVSEPKSRLVIERTSAVVHAATDLVGIVTCISQT